MKDAVGSTLLSYVVIIVIGIVGAIFIASNNYTKAYKAKNNIISIIDNNYSVHHKTMIEDSDYNGDCFYDSTLKSKCITSIESTLKNMGYIMSQNEKSVCDNIKSKKGYDEIVYPKDDDAFKGYCVYRVTLSEDTYYYSVVTFNHMNLNILGIGSLYSNPIYGQTRVYYKN